MPAPMLKIGKTMSDETRLISDEEHFMRIMANFNDFGDWRIRKAAAYGFAPPLVATLKGEIGRVEVWGGRAHRAEVWVVYKDKSETLVACDRFDTIPATYLSVRDGSLRQAIATACDLAGIQPKLF